MKTSGVTSQLKRLDENNCIRTRNFKRFLNKINPNRFYTNFKVEGSSNYAFNLILKKPDYDFVLRLMQRMDKFGIEYRRGSAGGGNQTRQPYLKGMIPKDYHMNFPETEHIHFFGFYIGNFPNLKDEEVDEICNVLNSAE